MDDLNLSQQDLLAALDGYSLVAQRFVEEVGNGQAPRSVRQMAEDTANEEGLCVERVFQAYLRSREQSIDFIANFALEFAKQHDLEITKGRMKTIVERRFPPIW